MAAVGAIRGSVADARVRMRWPLGIGRQFPGCRGETTRQGSTLHVIPASKACYLGLRSSRKRCRGLLRRCGDSLVTVEMLRVSKIAKLRELEGKFVIQAWVISLGIGSPIV